MCVCVCVCVCESSPGVDVGRVDGVEEQLGHSDPLHVDQVGLEESLGGLKALPTHLNHPAVRQLWGREGEEGD